MKKLSINLLQAELIPVQPLWTLKRVAFIWLGTFVIMFAWLFYSNVQLSQQTNELNKLTEVKQQNELLQAELEQQVSQNKADPLLQEKLATLKLLLVNKKALHKQLTDTSSTYAAGYSKAMTELSELHHQDVSLQKVRMNKGSMTFSGVARKPEAVPSWLAAFDNATFLSGQSFKHFSLSENEDAVTHFTVSSERLTEQSGGQ
ncbi:PilN domain-containing protein [Thalassotalea castellviae]|uniref:PilN domain-containing protein n=1 Tax=Thalassotalea castellviae TaxID=3075612 RepID=A0ABU2ZZE2_9GAMM|nr:PilN domain-containing protein [Thalassotalea sp. W431]MDT0603296.1 PilN domain-containing protein [Thalassotalea sp. W431]